MITLSRLITALPESARKKLTLSELEELVENLNTGTQAEPQPQPKPVVTLEEIEQAQAALDARIKEQHRGDGYLSDDPDGSGKVHSDQEWLAIKTEENRILKLRLTYAQQNPS